LKKNVGENIHSKNTYYRFLENDSFNWTRLLLLLDGAKRFGKEYTESIKCKVTYWIETNHRFYGLLEAVSSWES